MSNGPLPSVRCLLRDLRFHLSQKVRFLGCVTHYDTNSGALTLEHGSSIPARVDAKLILETLKSQQVDIGQWVHVIGYVTSFHCMTTKSKVRQSSASVRVQALVLWNAEDLDISAYERTFPPMVWGGLRSTSQSSSSPTQQVKVSKDVLD